MNFQKTKAMTNIQNTRNVYTRCLKMRLPYLHIGKYLHDSYGNWFMQLSYAHLKEIF